MADKKGVGLSPTIPPYQCGSPIREISLRGAPKHPSAGLGARESPPPRGPRRKGGLMSVTLLRHWNMMQLIPRYPQSIDPHTLQKRLEEEGFSADVRTIQRDLNDLADVFPLKQDTSSKPYLWYWDQKYVMDLPGMTPHIALTFMLASRHLEHMLPRSVVDQLSPYFDIAGNVLDRLRKRDYRSWAEKVQVLPFGFPLIAKPIDERVLNAVYQCLLDEKKLLIDYCPRGGKTRDYELNPLGLVFRNHVTYVVGTVWHYADLKQFVLHRIESATPTDKPIHRTVNFDLQRYIDEHEFEVRVDRNTFKLEAVFYEGEGIFVRETPMSDDQETEEMDDGKTRVTATVPNTRELRRWLRGFGDRVEIIGPSFLREEFKAAAKVMHARYG